MITAVERADGASLQRKLALRDEADRILALAVHLRRRERALVEHVYNHGRSIADLARVSGVPRRTLQHRQQRALRRLNSRTFRYVAVHLDTLPRPLQGIARCAVLEGRSLRDTARKTGRTLHDVRQSSIRLHALLEHRMAVDPTGR